MKRKRSSIHTLTARPSAGHERRAGQPVGAALEVAEAGVQRERAQRAEAAEVVLGALDGDRGARRQQPLVHRHAGAGRQLEQRVLEPRAAERQVGMEAGPEGRRASPRFVARSVTSSPSAVSR